MTLIFGLAVYFVIWFVALFVVLPIGIQSQQESGSVVPGSDPGAPVRPRILWRVAVNTILSLIIWGAADFAYIRFYLER